MNKLQNGKLSSTEIPNEHALNTACEILGAKVFLILEPSSFKTARYLSNSYDGGLWNFHKLTNGGFFMAPPKKKIYQLSCPNGYEGKVSSEAFGIIICLYVYSCLSFEEDENIRNTCSKHYHCLLEYARGLPAYQKILKAID